MQSDIENILVNSYKQDVICYIHDHPEDFDKVISLALSDKQPFAWRAAWLLCNCMEDNDKRLQPYIGKLISVLMNRKDGHQSSLLKILYGMELEEEHEALLFNCCVTLWENINKIPSVRLYALKTIVKMAEKYPDLSSEIISLVQDCYLESLSPGVRHSIEKLLRGLNRQKGINSPEL